MRSPATGGWPVWKVYQRRSESFRKVARHPWGCIGVVAAMCLLWQGLAAALVALLRGQGLPILLLLMGQLPLWVRLMKLAREMRRPCPDLDASATFLGHLTERGIQLASGHVAPWSAFSRWTTGWEDPHVFRISMGLAAGQDTQSLLRIRPRKWLWPGIGALVLALYLALQLPRHAIALQACLYFAGVYLVLFLLRRWSRRALQKAQGDIPEEPWVLIFDARQVSMDEVEALLERHLPRGRQMGG